VSTSLINKYNVAGPRYTSYPTVPYWDDSSFSARSYLRTLKATFDQSNSKGISVYIHLPFCESLCTFCACHKHITKRHEVEDVYIETVLKEWRLYVDFLKEKPNIKELHLGGGTPTFFSSKNLRKLMEGIFKISSLTAKYELSFEAHPNHTSREQLQALFDLGFRRLSFGIQDYGKKVQQAINRIQTFEQVQKVTHSSREIGYTSVSHDLVFGLPFQTTKNIKDSIQKTALLLPDRISLYSYAHVPWIKGVGQRGFDALDLPNANQKRELYESAKAAFTALGYEEIGMDHFALKSDSLYHSAKQNKMHRNFMGYTTNKTQLMIGLGMSAISDSWGGFAQNIKSVKDYQQSVQSNQFPLLRGHILSEEDKVIRLHILNIMCHFETSWQKSSMKFDGLAKTLNRLQEMEKDGLI
jgi:oxygen-independent coproporphyrinogen III oxidase